MRRCLAVRKNQLRHGPSGVVGRAFSIAVLATQITRAEQPVKVLEECVRRCQEDRTTAVAQCLSFDFMPGRRRPATPATASGSAPVEFEESVCYLYYDRASPDGGETLVRQNNAWHFNEVCLSCEEVLFHFSKHRTSLNAKPRKRRNEVQIYVTEMETD